jgi:hypothetical protein
MTSMLMTAFIRLHIDFPIRGAFRSTFDFAFALAFDSAAAFIFAVLLLSGTTLRFTAAFVFGLAFLSNAEFVVVLPVVWHLILKEILRDQEFSSSGEIEDAIA